jgi:hypothetical protein
MCTITLMASQMIHEEILDMVENSRGELKSQVVKLTNAKYPRKGLKFDTINKYYHDLLKTIHPKDILIVGQPLDGNFVTIKAQNYASEDLKHADENYYSSKPKEVKDRLQGVYYSVTVTIMISKKK